MKDGEEERSRYINKQLGRTHRMPCSSSYVVLTSQNDLLLRPTPITTGINVNQR